MTPTGSPPLLDPLLSFPSVPVHVGALHSTESGKSISVTSLHYFTFFLTYLNAAMQDDAHKTVDDVDDDAVTCDNIDVIDDVSRHDVTQV